MLRYKSIAICLSSFVLSFALVVSRRADAIFNAQFWAEDGKIWYAEAHNYGIIQSLFDPHNGFLYVVARLTAAFSQLFPLSTAPLIFNSVAIFIQVLPAVFLVSSRLSSLLPSIKTRAILAFIYLALPGTAEINANITNSHWYLALLAFMVIISEPGRGFLWKGFDICIIILSCLSGPFAILLSPITFVLWWIKRDKRRLSVFVLVGVCAIIQILGLVFFAGGRAETALGPSIDLFVSIVAGQIFLLPLVGGKGVDFLATSGGYLLIKYLFFCIGVLIVVYSLMKCPLELKLFVLFSCLIFFAALISPPEEDVNAWWVTLNVPSNGGRYWFFPNLAFVITLIWLFGQIWFGERFVPKILAGLIVAVMAIGIYLNWRHPNYQDFRFYEYAEYYEKIPRGSRLIIPINPDGWLVQLVKK